jgi:hypothetical protein
MCLRGCLLLAQGGAHSGDVFGACLVGGEHHYLRHLHVRWPGRLQRRRGSWELVSDNSIEMCGLRVCVCVCGCVCVCVCVCVCYRVEYVVRYVVWVQGDDVRVHSLGLAVVPHSYVAKLYR